MAATKSLNFEALHETFYTITYAPLYMKIFHHFPDWLIAFFKIWVDYFLKIRVDYFFKKRVDDFF